MKKPSFWCGVIAGLLAAVPAAAWDGEKRGKIAGLDVVSDGGNFGFRVYMNAGPMCQTSETWAYINSNTNNYEAMVSLLTTMYLAGKEVTILTTRNGVYCEIGYVQVR
ncbi:hypothetical protein [Sphingomonas phyllosphaerae]|uniref:hypothetical protein n=1 Tax=Sphingomonas phyllosphaerae TaxID=257003 RepID=UPI0003B6D3F0|nr:hypothetical protein [Sphingomonas phyllosphaerae]